MCSVLLEKLDYFLVAHMNSHIQRRHAIFSLGVHVRTISDQHFDHSFIVHLSGRVQGRHAIFSRGVHVRALNDQQLGNLLIAFTYSGPAQRRGPEAWALFLADLAAIEIGDLTFLT